MFGSIDIAISAIVVSAISLTTLSSGWSWANVGNDVKLISIAIVACWMLVRFRSIQSHVDKKKESVQPPQPDVVQFDVNKHIELMKKCAWERNIGGAMRSFRSIKQSGACLSSLMFNTVLQACVNCGNIQAAEDWMDEIKEAGMVDECSFNILIKALVTACTLEKAHKVLMTDMKSAGVEPSTAAFNEVLCGFAREGRFEESYSLLERMTAQGLQPNSITLNAISKLLNSSTGTSQRIQSVEKLLSKCKFVVGVHSVRTCISSDTLLPVPVPSPCIASVISSAKHAKRALCTHEVRLSGSLSQMKATQRTLQQQGFLHKSEGGGWPLDGHWETDRGFTVVVEGKMVRWSARNASRLRYTRHDRSTCVLTLYGEAAHGSLIGHAADGPQTLRWDNGDVWYPCDGRAIGHNILFSQTMTKIYRDTMQDEMYRARARATLMCVSKQALHMPSVFEDAITQFLGNDLYCINICFESRWNPSNVDEDEFSSEDVCVSISRRHPRIGLRHCWADYGNGSCGQRTWVNGEELDDHCFCKHMGAVSWT